MFMKCRVCGFTYEDEDNTPPWVEVQGSLYPSHEICVCCNCEFGFDDFCLSAVRDYREKWISSSRFSNLHFKPMNWSVENQLLEIEEDWR